MTANVTSAPAAVLKSPTTGHPGDGARTVPVRSTTPWPRAQEFQSPLRLSQAMPRTAQESLNVGLSPVELSNTVLRRLERVMRLLPIKCSACGETKGHHALARSEYPPIAPQLVGGVLLTLVFVLSRKRRFRCGRCAKEFFCHTLTSRVWLALWIFFWICLAIAIAVIFIPFLQE